MRSISVCFAAALLDGRDVCCERGLGLVAVSSLVTSRTRSSSRSAPTHCTPACARCTQSATFVAVIFLRGFQEYFIHEPSDSHAVSGGIRRRLRCRTRAAPHARRGKCAGEPAAVWCGSGADEPAARPPVLGCLSVPSANHLCWLMVLDTAVISTRRLTWLTRWKTPYARTMLFTSGGRLDRVRCVYLATSTMHGFTLVSLRDGLDESACHVYSYGCQS